MRPVLLHRSYADSEEKLFEYAWQYGFQGVEVNAPGLSCDLAEIGDVTEKLAALKEKWLTRDIVLHFPMSLINDGEWAHRESIFEKMRESFRLTSRELGVTVFNTMAAGTIIPDGNAYTDYHLNGSAAATDVHWQRAVEILRTACDMASDFGITLAIETHGCLLHDLPEPTLKLIEHVDRDNLTINLDIPNIALVRRNVPADSDIEPLLSRIGHVHLKNLRMVIGGGFLLEGVGNGIINYESLFQSLDACGYRGAYSLEFPGRYGDMEHNVKSDINYVKNVQLAGMAS